MTSASLAKVSRLIFCLIAEFYSAAAGNPIVTAAVNAYQPLGDSLRFNPRSQSPTRPRSIHPPGSPVAAETHL